MPAFTRRAPSIAVNATRIVRDALSGTGIDLVASCSVDAYDARAPDALRSSAQLPGARGLVVAASAGTALWNRFRERLDDAPGWWRLSEPYDAFVSEALDAVDAALAWEGVRSVRFDAAFHATVRVDFVALARLVGLGSPGPFGLLIHPDHGAWWALRGAWLVDGAVEPPAPSRPPCAGCDAPCIGGWPNRGGPRAQATPEVRARCVVGQASRYDDDQIAYHYNRAQAVVRLRAPSKKP
jgi:hypothetical protein